jgi:hypothetical protein
VERYWNRRALRHTGAIAKRRAMKQPRVADPTMTSSSELSYCQKSNRTVTGVAFCSANTALRRAIKNARYTAAMTASLKDRRRSYAADF